MNRKNWASSSALVFLVAAGLAVLPVSAATDEKELHAQLSIASQAIRMGAFKQAVEAYEKADKLAGGRSAPALVGLATAENHLGKLDRAIASARRALAIEGAEPAVRGAAYNQLGVALSRKAGPKDRSGLEDAAQAFRQAAELDAADTGSARFNLGVLLLRLGREDEGKAALAAFVGHRADADDSTTAEAKALLADPRRASGNFVPAFKLTTLTGETITAASLQGKVVLLDFWATWCVPCVEALPEVKALAKRMAGRPFAVIGLSADNDGEKLRRFIAEKGIDWPQFWDEKKTVIGGTFNVHQFPTYMVLDGDGQIVEQHYGWAGQRDRRLDDAIRKALAATKRMKTTG